MSSTSSRNLLKIKKPRRENVARLCERETRERTKSQGSKGQWIAQSSKAPALTRGDRSRALAAEAAAEPVAAPVPPPAAEVHVADVQVAARVAVDDGPEVEVDGVAILVLLQVVRDQVLVLEEGIEDVRVERGLPLQLLPELGADDRLPLQLTGVEMQEHLVASNEQEVADALHPDPPGLAGLGPLDRRVRERDHGRRIEVDLDRQVTDLPPEGDLWPGVLPAEEPLEGREPLLSLLARELAVEITDRSDHTGQSDATEHILVGHGQSPYLPRSRERSIARTIPVYRAPNLLKAAV